MQSPGQQEVEKELPALLPRMWRFALYLCRDGAAAEDLVQATCLRALEKSGQYTPGTKLSAWLFSVMTSIWKNQLRRQSNSQIDDDIPIDRIEIGVGNDAELSLFSRQVLEAIVKLPEGQRMAVALVYVEGFSYKEAAESLSVPIGTVMSRLANARKSLAHLKEPSRRDGVEDGAPTP